MINSAASFLKLDLAASVMVGDKADDMRAAKAAGIPVRILVRSGKEVTQEAMDEASVVLDSIADVPKYLASLA